VRIGKEPARVHAPTLVLGGVSVLVITFLVALGTRVLFDEKAGGEPSTPPALETVPTLSAARANR
jgi:hypothetical protein